MKFVTILLINILCVNSYVLRHNNVTASGRDETFIPTEIISNYLNQHLSCHDVFLSISLTSTPDDREYFQEDLISNLVVHSKLENFTYNILNSADQMRRGNKNVFNLVLIDRSSLLM